MLKGDSEYAGKHQHGVQVKETGTTGNPVTEERVAALEARVKDLEAQVAAIALLGKATAEAAKTPKKEKAA